MDVYSTILAGSMIVVGSGAIAAIAATVMERRATGRSRRWWWIACVTSVLALVLVIVATIVHVIGGHLPGSERALRSLPFLVQHPAIPMTAIIAGGLMGWSARRLR